MTVLCYKINLKGNYSTKTIIFFVAIIIILFFTHTKKKNQTEVIMLLLERVYLLETALTTRAALSAMSM